jgi:catechol 2,3-dioxygenase-like lactoylglutathione lyase family enzyme
MPKYWFDHVHLISRDPEKTADFYEKNFGTKRDGFLKLPDGRVLTSTALEGASIKVTNPRPEPLVPNTLPEGLGLEHFGFRTDNLEEAVAELKANGVKCVQEIKAISPTTKIAFFLSPEDILIELLEVSD